MISRAMIHVQIFTYNLSSNALKKVYDLSANIHIQMFASEDQRYQSDAA